LPLPLRLAWPSVPRRRRAEGGGGGRAADRERTDKSAIIQRRKGTGEGRGTDI
jgi:hypothetical protein